MNSGCRAYADVDQTDLFKQRLFVSPLTKHFPDYAGDATDYNAARAYFQRRFTKLNRSPSKEGASVQTRPS